MFVINVPSCTDHASRTRRSGTRLGWIRFCYDKRGDSCRGAERTRVATRRPSKRGGKEPYARARGGVNRNVSHLRFVRGDAQAAGGRRESGMRGSPIPFAHATS